MDKQPPISSTAVSVKPKPTPTPTQQLESKKPHSNARVVVYDDDEETVKVLKEKEAQQTGNFNWPLRLPPKIENVCIFIDSATGIPTLASVSGNQRCNDLLTMLHLDKIEFSNRILRHLGKLETLYVASAEPWESDGPEGVGAEMVVE